METAPKGTLAAVLRARRDAIVSRFIAAVQREDLSPAGLARSHLIDHIPKFLDEIIGELEVLAASHAPTGNADPFDRSQTAREHGEQRWGLGYDLEALIREYGVLRHCIFETLREDGASPSLDEVDVFAKCLSVGVAEAATAYVGYRDREVDRQRLDLQFLADAGGLLTSSLDYRSTLSRLIALVVPRMADWCAVHVEGISASEMPIAHVDPAKREILRELFTRFPPPPDAPQGHLHVARTGKPQMVTRVAVDHAEAIAQSPEHLALIRQIGVCSWIIVPLGVQEHTFGAVMLAYSDSGRHYEERDLVLAMDVARRAAVAIDNARLFALSQTARSRVEAATRAKDEFVAMVSHELRTPLNAILGWLQLMRGGTLDGERREHAIRVIERNAKAQSRLVADLLDISNIFTGRIRITPSQLDLRNVVEMATEGLRPAAEAKRLRMEMDIAGVDAVLRGDGDRLQQVVWNLLANAVKFTPKNGTIRVTLKRVASDIEIGVADDGEGIDPAFLPHVFESFRQSDTSATRPHGGLGIGLSIAKHIVELHGGSIRAQSAGRGHGATFIVCLPVSSMISSTLGVSRVPATTGPSDEDRPPRELQGKRVLVVDDEGDARELVAYVLETCGVEVRLAASAEDARMQLETFTPDAIISDIGMPHEDGYALIRSIRMLPDPSKRNMSAIALTAYAANEVRTRALIEGFNVHMTKPVEPAELLRTLVDLIGHATR